MSQTRNISGKDKFFLAFGEHICVVPRTIQSNEPETQTLRQTRQLRVSNELVSVLGLENLKKNNKNVFSQAGYVGDYTYYDLIQLDSLGSGDAENMVFDAMYKRVEKILGNKHKEIMRLNAKLIPLFRAKGEFEKLKTSKTLNEEESERFTNCITTAEDILHVIYLANKRVEANTTNPEMPQLTHTYKLGNSTIGFDSKEVNISDVDSIKTALDLLTKQLHGESKELYGTKKGKVIGSLMMALGALAVAAGAALGFTLVGIPFGAAISAGGATLFAGGLATYNNRQYFSKSGRLIDKQYRQLKSNVNQIKNSM